MGKMYLITVKYKFLKIILRRCPGGLGSEPGFFFSFNFLFTLLLSQSFEPTLQKLGIYFSHDNESRLKTAFLIRVARWFVFKPKIQIRVSFGGSCNGR
jgi:hypothetical protein